MFFILSKVLYFIIKPMSIIFILILYALLSRSKLRYKALKTGVILLLLFGNKFFFNEMAKWWEEKPLSLAETGNYELGIVLGGGLNHSLPINDRTHISQAGDRLIQAIQLYHHRKIKKIIYSGGSGSIMNEDSIGGAERAYMLMISSGVCENDILLENESLNTHENATFTKRIMNEAGININQPTLLITSASHMPRSLMCYKNEGFHPAPFAADFYANYKYLNWEDYIIPSAGTLYDWERYIKEWVGIIVYKLAGYA